MTADILTADSWARAEGDSLTNQLELIPQSASLWPESMLWDKDVVLRAGLGYKDNVLLAPKSPRGSPFFTTGLDLTIFRLPLDGWEVSLSVVGDDIRYWRNPAGLKGEDLFLGSAQVQKYFASVWRSGAELRYSYIDQVLEEFLIAGGAQAIHAKGNTVGVRPFIRRDFSTNWWVELEAPLARDWWQTPLDPAWKFGGQAVGGWSYGPHSQVSLAAGGFYLPHDQWLARDQQGNELPGRRLALWREVVELKWEHQWTATNRWLTTTKLGFNHTKDNGGGFFDSNRYYASEAVRLRTRDWEAKASAGASYYQFPIQTIDAPPAPKLHLATLELSLRVERRLYRSIRAFAAFEYEQTLSNDAAAEYKARVVSAGLSWEF